MRVKGGAGPDASPEAARLAKVRVDAVSDLASEIEWAKTMQIRPDGYAAAARGRDPGANPEELAAVYAAYEQLRRERHLLRLWLSVPDGRPVIPEVFTWGNIYKALYAA